MPENDPYVSPFKWTKGNLKKPPTQCAVCSAPAIYSYVGVIVCPSCKVFFRRNAQNQQKHLRCHFDDHCEINVNTRHICASCRLKKCFATGMQVDLFRGSTSKKGRSTHQLQPVSQIRTLSLLNSDRSGLTTVQWTLLSNMIHCYDENSRNTEVKLFLDEQQSLPVKRRFRVDALNQFFQLIVSGVQPLFERNGDFLSLTTHDQLLLLGTTLKQVGGLVAGFTLRTNNIYDDPGFYEASASLYGSETMDNGFSATTYFDPDGTVVKLFFSIIIFSTLDCTYYRTREMYTFDNIKRILEIQDQYAELAWRYLIYRYDHQRAVNSFSRLIRCVFFAINSMMAGGDGQDFKKVIKSVTQQTKESLQISD